MDKYFYDKKNFDNINLAINQTILKKTGQNVNPIHSKLVYQFMKYIFDNTEKPKGLRKKQFLSILNHQVLQVAVPRIEKLTLDEVSATNTNSGVTNNNFSNSVGNAPMPTMNSQTKEEFNFDKRFKEAQRTRSSIPVQTNMMQNGNMQNSNMQNSNMQQQQQLEVVADNAMTQEETDKRYNEMMAQRQMQFDSAPSDITKQQLNKRNEGMTNFENKNKELNNGIEEYSDRIEERGEGEKMNLNEQFQPILSQQLHPAVNQSSGLNDLIKQDVNSLLAKRQDENVIIKDNGGFNGGFNSGFNGGEFSDKSLNNVGDKMGENVNPMVESMLGSSVIETQNGVDMNRLEQQNMNAFKQQMIVPPVPKEKYIKREYFINVDSRDRDLEVYPDVNKFQIKFSPSSDSQELFQYRDNEGNILYETKKGFMGDGHGASLPEIYDNIYSIECVSATVPYDITYVCGICPYKFNSYQNDENIQTDEPQRFKTWAYGPVFDTPTGNLSGQRLGIATSVLDEPYLLLNVDELEGNNPYIGTNKATTNTFAKLLHDGYFGVLTSFIQLKTDHGTKKVYKPQALGKLDKMTLNLVKHNGKHYNFGMDKMYVKCFEEVEGDECSTRVVIVAPNDECGDCGKSHGHCLRPGNLLYFYDTLDCVNNEVLFYKTINPQVSMAEGLGNDIDTVVERDVDIVANELKISGSIKDTGKGVNFSAFLEVGDYLMLNSDVGEKYSVRIKRFASGSNGGVDIYTNRPSGFSDSDVAIRNFGFYRKNMKGITSDVKGNFNYIDGKRVCATQDDDFVDCAGDSRAANMAFYINFPYASLPERLRGKDLSFGNGSGKSEVFFIKKRMQVSYTFRVTVLEQDVDKIHSTMI